MTADFTTIPIDAAAAEGVAATGLRLGLVDTGDARMFGAWLQADMRGFHGAQSEQETVDAFAKGLAYRRTTAVWDGTDPIATVNSWPGELSVPGARSVTAWAISSVTVAPTHRRQGLARNLLEAELRTAAALGVPLAMLTVSESTIYARFGFGIATMSADWRIDTRRAKWAGPETSGRLRFITLDQFREHAPRMHDLIRLASPGEIDLSPFHWDRTIGMHGEDKEHAKSLRSVLYEDADGQPQGVLLYRVTGGDDDFSAHTLVVESLVCITPEAYAALWRYLLEVDLVSEVKASLRAVDEPLPWQVSDMRAVRITTRDHLWLRILDVKAALTGRLYSAPARIALQLTDDLGFADGLYLVEIDAKGVATVDRIDRVTDDAAALAMDITELGALYLGGVSAATLVAAGRIAEVRPGSAAAMDTAFRPARAPALSAWF